MTFWSGESASAMISGFTITNGLGASGSTDDDSTGGGVQVSNASPTIVGNRIVWNSARAGAGIRVYGARAAPEVTQNLIEENTASGTGGGVYLVTDSSGYIANTTSVAKQLSVTRRSGHAAR